ncbi:gluconate kinase [Oceanobacillus piezotolerans]|uniref:Gluconate kinase n=1 Tax=Oceanobacillus piezotolerans TaxID=2448030 RepID=A0A498D3J2_9BACI|nr:gluconokinase [Oceanobacillus piezotolerans]RLL40699.1 gluconate kinase [Oceanobacillus piezotolerans]
MQRELVIGLDIGTTSAKSVVFDLKGNLIAEAEELVETYYPNPGWAEQSPKEVEDATAKALKDSIQKASAKPEEILSVGISCAMHSLICLDDAYQPLSQMLIWSDTRSSELAERFIHDKGNNIFSRTGTPIHPMSPFVKLMWMKENHYEAYEKAAYFMTMKEYLLYKWFGEKVADYSMASSTGLMNVEKLDWDEDALELAGIRADQLSKIVPPTEILTNINGEVAEEIGISVDTPFVIGAADGQLANLGSGAISPGEVNVSVGTSGAIRQFVKGAPVNDKMETFTYAFTDDTSIIGGPTNNGGIALQWLKDIIEFKGTHDELVAGAAQVEVGSGGIIFLPYVNGERAPLWNGRAKGNFYGLDIAHTKDHLVRAVLEGVTFNIYQIGKSLEKIAGKPEKITVNGGLSKSRLWVQIMADVFGQEIYLSDTHHNAAWGAAWTALVGIGKAETFADIKSSLPAESVTQPNMENHEKYKEIYKQYEELGHSIEKFF